MVPEVTLARVPTRARIVALSGPIRPKHDRDATALETQRHAGKRTHGPERLRNETSSTLTPAYLLALRIFPTPSPPLARRTTHHASLTSMTAAAALSAEQLPALQRLRQAVEAALEGKQDAVELALVALLARGHLLIEDVPGVGKTTLARALARSVAATFDGCNLQATFPERPPRRLRLRPAHAASSCSARARYSPTFSWPTRSTARVHALSRRSSRP